MLNVYGVDADVELSVHFAMSQRDSEEVADEHSAWH